MKLDVFLTEPAFSRYAKNINDIREEFISEGCEKFLWINHTAQVAAWKYTKEIAAVYPPAKENTIVKAFLDQFSHINPEKQLYFIFPEDYTPFYHTVSYISKSANETYIINNLVPEDETRNVIAIFDKDSCSREDIGMLFTYVYGMKGAYADTNGGYKLFGRGLMYYFDCLEYQGQMISDFEKGRQFAHFQGNFYRRDTNPFELLAARKYTKMLIRFGYFKDEYELMINLQDYILPLFQQQYDTVRLFLEPGEENWWDAIKRVKETLILDGTIARKWKSEKTLFGIAKRLYPDARFQYYPKWLEPQSLDIYIPSINVWIEYQGLQHYEPVDFFGGEIAFNHRNELDQRKRILCKQNNVTLIEWKYNIELTRENFKLKLAEVGINNR